MVTNMARVVGLTARERDRAIGVHKAGKDAARIHKRRRLRGVPLGAHDVAKGRVLVDHLECDLALNNQAQPLFARPVLGMTVTVPALSVSVSSEPAPSTMARTALGETDPFSSATGTVSATVRPAGMPTLMVGAVSAEVPGRTPRMGSVTVPALAVLLERVAVMEVTARLASRSMRSTGAVFGAVYRGGGAVLAWGRSCFPT